MSWSHAGTEQLVLDWNKKIEHTQVPGGCVVSHSTSCMTRMHCAGLLEHGSLYFKVKLYKPCARRTSLSED